MKVRLHSKVCPNPQEGSKQESYGTERTTAECGIKDAKSLQSPLVILIPVG